MKDFGGGCSGGGVVGGGVGGGGGGSDVRGVGSGGGGRGGDDNGVNGNGGGGDIEDLAVADAPLLNADADAATAAAAASGGVGVDDAEDLDDGCSDGAAIGSARCLERGNWLPLLYESIARPAHVTTLSEATFVRWYRTHVYIFSVIVFGFFIKMITYHGR
jgi:hypothetical protein